MSDTQKQVCWIALDREDAESLRGHASKIRTNLKYRLINAIDKSLVTECCEVGGEVASFNGDSIRMISAVKVPADHPTGPCRVIVIAGERDG